MENQHNNISGFRKSRASGPKESWTEKVKSSQHEKQNFKTKIKKKISKVYFLNCELLSVKQRSSHKGPRFQPCSKV